jgi:hypothetical protein
MKKLGERNYLLISMSMEMCGFHEPWDGMMYEEKMYCSEVHEIIAFLEWLHKSGRPFGQANYEQRFKEFKTETK